MLEISSNYFSMKFFVYMYIHNSWGYMYNICGNTYMKYVCVRLKYIYIYIYIYIILKNQEQGAS